MQEHLSSLRLFTIIRKYPFWKFIRQYRHEYAWGLVALLFVDVINVALPLMVKMAVDAIEAKDFTSILWAGGIYLALTIGQGVGRYLWRMYLIGTSHRVAQTLRLRIYDHLQRLPLSYYQRVRSGDLMSRATNDVESVRMAVGPGILVSVDAILVFGLMVPVMFWLSWKLSLLTFAFYPFVPLLTLKVGERIDRLFEKLQSRMSDLSAFTQESFSAIRLIKSLVLENHTRKKFEKLSGQYLRSAVTLSGYEAILSPSLALITSLGTFLTLWVGGWDVVAGAISIGTFVAFQRYVVQLGWPMEAIGWAVTMNQEGIAAYRRLEQVFQVPSTHTPPFESVAETQSSTRQCLLRVHKLHFRYPSSETHAFGVEVDELDLQKGKKVGVVGRVGSGKSSLFQLLLRLYEPPPQTIFFQGRDISFIPLEVLRQKIVSVEQGIFLFSENIRTNILLGTLRERYSDADVIRATKAAGIHDEIDALENKYATILGERGVNLSGGQKQRVALSRALVREPQLLLLDDCFSAIDVEVEQSIIANLFENYPDLTVLFASHRLSVMPHMDEVWIMDRGSIVEQGPHATLTRESPLYAEMWQRSLKDEAKESFEGALS